MKATEANYWSVNHLELQISLLHAGEEASSHVAAASFTLMIFFANISDVL